MKEFVTETGPVSKQLQAADCDLSLATTVIRTVVKKFKTMRDAGDVKWLEATEDTTSFCYKYDLPTGLRAERAKK